MIKGIQNFPEKNAFNAAILIIVFILRFFPFFSLPLIFSKDTYTRIKKFSSFCSWSKIFFMMNIC